MSSLEVQRVQGKESAIGRYHQNLLGIAEVACDGLSSSINFYVNFQ